MIVQTEFNTYDNVTIREDGAWMFTWNDEEGQERIVTYTKHNAEKYVASGDWKIIIPVGKQKAAEVEVEQTPTDNYAAAFNMWMDTYINSPQSFEDSYSTALNHVSEKLLGEEPSYGEVAAEQFKAYLEKVK